MLCLAFKRLPIPCNLQKKITNARSRGNHLLIFMPHQIYSRISTEIIQNTTKDYKNFPDTRFHPIVKQTKDLH